MKFAFARSALKPLSFFLIALCLITFSLYKLAHSKGDSTENNSLEPNLYGIAINPITDIAVVTDDKADSVSIVDANTGKTLSKVSVGKAPKGVEIDRGLNIAVVSNSYDDSISILDLNTYQVAANMPVGRSPEGIAVNQLNHTALIANYKDETISVIDLLNYKVIKTIPIGKEPKDIAIDPALNLALIVSEQRDKGIHTVSVIDLITYQVAAEVFVGKNPQAVDINPKTHLAAVANAEDNTITVIDLQTWKTSNISVGRQPIDVAINQLNNSALVLCYEDKSVFQIDLNTKTIIKEYAVKEDLRDVSVNNFTNIAAAIDNKADSLKLIQLSNPVPHINSINPPVLERGVSNRKINIEGAQFIKASTVLLQSASSSYLLSSIFIDNNIIETEIPETIVARAGIYQIIVANPPPEGGMSNPYEFKIIEPIQQISAPNPVPLLTSVTPLSIIAGSPDFALYLAGNNFIKTTIIRFNNQQYPAKHINKTQIEAAIPTSALKTAGVYPVEVINPAPGGGASNTINLEVRGLSNIPITPPEDNTISPQANAETKGSPSIWIGEERKVIEVSTEDGKHLLEIPAKHLEDVAVDNYRGVVWVGTRKEIVQYALNGQELFRHPLNIKTKDKDDDKDSKCAKGKDKDCDEDSEERVVHISLDYSDGSLWIGAKDEVIKLSYDGQELFRIKDVGHIQDVSVDISNSTCWVGLKDKVIKYSQDGKPLLDFSIEDGNKIHALAAEPFSNSLWIGTKKGLIKVDENGSEQFRTEEPHDIQDLKVNTTDASLCLVTKKEVFKYSTEGKRIFRNVPCPDKDDGKDDEDKDKEKSNKSRSDDHDDDGGKDKDEDHDNGKECEGNLITLTIDPYDGSGWIAWRKAILKLSSVGEHLLWLKGFKQIEAIDIGLLGLAVKITEPLNGAVVDVPSIAVKGTVTDPTANVTVNGVIATVTGNIFEAQGVQLSLGNNTITAIATNLAHLTASNTIQVTYRQPLTIRINFPENGAILLTSPINVTGAVSNANARVTVNSIDAAIYENNFTAAGIGLTLGENIITATATDDLGRKATDTIKVIYQPWIDVSITSPSNGAVLSASPIDVTGIVNDPNAYVEVNGTQARVAQDGRFTASGVRLYEGVNQITAQAANKLGQTDSDTVNVIYQPPSVPLSVTILSPKDGSIIETPNITVKGAVTDPNATVLVNDTLAQVDDGFFTANIYACEGPDGPMVAALNALDINSWTCTITVTAYSKDGQKVIISITYTYVPSQNPLTIGITAPADNSVFTSSPIEVKGRINDALSNISPTVVTVVVAGNEIPAIVQGDTFIANIPLNDGINYITAHAKNMVGSDAYDTIRIIYEPSTKPLSITITSPINNSIVNYSSIRVSGNVSDSTAIVEINGIRAAQDFRGFALDSLPLSIGENIITARATRPNGEIATAAIRVTYDPSYPSPPPPILSELPQYSQAFVGVSGLTLPNYGVEVFVNGVIYEAPIPIVADSTGLFNAFALLTAEGPNRISARAVDPFGNRSALSNERVVIRDTIAPIMNASYGIVEGGLAVSRILILGYTEAFAEIEIIFDQDPDYRYNLTADERGKFAVITHLSAGKHRVQITIKDRAGNIYKYDKVNIFHSGSDMPISPMIDPIPNPINESIITVEGNAYAGFYVELYRNNELMGGMVYADRRGRFRFEGINLMPGRNILKVKQLEQVINLGWFTPSQFIRGVESHEVIVDVISGMPVRPEVKIDFPVNEAVTNSEFLPLRGIINDPAAVLRNNGYYSIYDNAVNLNGRFASSQRIPLLPGKNILWIEAALPDGTRGVDKIDVYYKRDIQMPSVNITNPVTGGEVYDRFITVTGTTDNIVQRVIVNENEALSDNGSFISDVVATSGAYTTNPDYSGLGYSMITAWAMDGNGRIGYHNINVRYKYMPTPQLYITSPADGEILSASPVTVRGEVYDATEVRVNGVLAQITRNVFNMDIELTEGQNVITVMARNAGKAVVQTVTVTYQPSSPVVLQSIAILPSNPSVSLGETTQLRAIGTYSNGQEIDLTAGALWTSSNPNIAAINRGLVTGRSMGSSTITATYGGVIASTTIYIGSAVIESIIIMYPIEGMYYANNPDVTIGETLRLMAVGYYSNGSLIELGGSSVVWNSSNPSVATIGSTGVATGLAKGTTQITATYQSISGSAILTVKPRGISVFITSPVDGSTINRPEITVRGAIGNPSGKETGVTVNGIIATVSGNQFVANHIPLIEGQNTITAVATDAEGGTDSNSITVNAVTTGNYIRLTATPESGISPLETTLKIDSTFSIETSSISYRGPGGVEWLSSSVDEYRIRLTAEGIHTFTANAIGPDRNTIYQDTVAIVVQNRTQLDNLLKNKWEEMKAALMRGDVEGAVGYFAEGSKNNLRQQFTALSSILPQIASEMGAITLVNVKGNTAEYDLRVVRNGITYSFQLIFVCDKDGIWRIRSF